MKNASELTRENNVGIYRLAEQLDLNPHELTAKIIAAGIRAIDGSLGELGQVDWPLHFETCDPDSSIQSFARITEQLNTAKPKQMLELEEEGEGIPQTVLWNRATIKMPDVEIDSELLREARAEARAIGVNLPTFIARALRNHVEAGAH